MQELINQMLDLERSINLRDTYLINNELLGDYVKWVEELEARATLQLGEKHNPLKDFDFDFEE